MIAICPAGLYGVPPHFYTLTCGCMTFPPAISVWKGCGVGCGGSSRSHYPQSGPRDLEKDGLVSLGPSCYYLRIWGLLERVFFFLSGLLSLLGFFESPAGILLAKKAAGVPPTLSDAEALGEGRVLPSCLPSSETGAGISEWVWDSWCPVNPKSKARRGAVWLCPEQWGQSCWRDPDVLP